MATFTKVLIVDSSGVPVAGTGGGAATVADGADVNQGTTTDAKVTGDTAGTASAKLRGLNTVTGTPSDTAASVTLLGRLIKLVSLLPTALGAATPAASLATVEAYAATGTSTSVASSASSVTVLASNTARRGATVYNDSTSVLYLKLGATASTTSYSVQLAASDYYEVPFRYAGIIDGIWATANGNARVTELS